MYIKEQDGNSIIVDLDLIIPREFSTESDYIKHVNFIIVNVLPSQRRRSDNDYIRKAEF